jgi:hypothetical protein
MDQTGFDPKRRLCPDGSCVGVINPDGRCTECGRTAAASAAGQESDRAPEGEPAGEEEFRAEAADPSGGAGLEASGFDPNRRLCADGSCVGVVGVDGVCTVCGLKTAD